MAWDHPRSCGKDNTYQIQHGAEPGSPPLVRERRFTETCLGKYGGITPARAGKTCRSGRFYHGLQDHPRSCGKDRYTSTQRTPSKGSPPLVRERHNILLTNTLTTGITPARAGKTASTCTRLASSRDHPRSCGKDAHRYKTAAGRTGSPPLVRERQLITKNT